LFGQLRKVDKTLMTSETRLAQQSVLMLGQKASQSVGGWAFSEATLGSQRALPSTVPMALKLWATESELMMATTLWECSSAKKKATP
jgi:hypothetical protein